jgi:hypothetical protein
MDTKPHMTLDVFKDVWAHTCFSLLRREEDFLPPFECVTGPWSEPYMHEESFWTQRADWASFKRGIERCGPLGGRVADESSGKGPNHTAGLLWNARDNSVSTGLVLAHAFGVRHGRSRGPIGECCLSVRWPPLGRRPWHHAVTATLPGGTSEMYDDLYERVLRRADTNNVDRQRIHEAEHYVLSMALADFLLSLQSHVLVHVTLAPRAG